MKLTGAKFRTKVSISVRPDVCDRKLGLPGWHKRLLGCFWLPSIFGQYEFASAFRSPNTAQRNSHRLIGIELRSRFHGRGKLPGSLPLYFSPRPGKEDRIWQQVLVKYWKRLQALLSSGGRSRYIGRNGACTGNQSANLNKWRNFLLRWDLCKWIRIH
jgi:hypothetical protein